MPKKPNILLIAIDSIRADHMSGYGYPRLTTPHIDRFAESGTLFENTFSAHIPTTPAYASMLTGLDCFGTQVVALRHKGPLRAEAPTAAEILREHGYNTTCVGFTGNPSARGFDNYIDYAGWGSWKQGRSPKAENLNQVAIPELKRLCAEDKPWFVMLRHMDPHAPYLPPAPYERMFYHGDETDPDNHSMEPVLAFKPFADFFKSWMPPSISDKDYIIAQYDGAIAYMDACIQSIFQALESLGILDETIIALNGDHGETLYDHECWFDHHSIYDNVLHVPLILRYPGAVPAGARVSGYNQHKDLLPTLLELAGLETQHKFDGRSLLPMARGEVASHESEFFISECTWMRKQGWRTPTWKLMVALEPDFHFKPEVELYNLVEDPNEDNNLAEAHPDVVAALRGRMDAWIARREAETGLPNPMLHQGDWHGKAGVGAFTSSQQAYDTLYIGDLDEAIRLQAESRE
ncbi:MAG: sulfatase-like hydrolase/transferase [Chloroflexi bacterium]|nr:sulfatase-like hydrolase/transferase [Chloroflexota bacterium]MXX83601.1 sulfatase-like hydrolase/transferase [Chloroflexota bacterium]MYA92115.1 sulfatase-like hydrolase/transferase [Chloroflexota bacterium]MYC56189.1 sulfatase-like hydrolase/transferase [Chloroflexota bacterium]MYD38779.1 sulfatase-like hydrolase/transferase [Chloroflexota bacterium]